MVTLINPNLVVQKSDIFTTGIVYMPVGLASFAAVLKKNGFICQVIDAFAEKPNQCRDRGDFLLRGLLPSEIAQKVPGNSDAIVIYAINSAAHLSIMTIIKFLRKHFARIPIIIMENTQAVTGYSLKNIQNLLYDAGFDYIITGEAENRGVELLHLIKSKAKKCEIAKIDGIGFRDNGKQNYQPPLRKIKDLDALPFPAWESFPLENYWNLRYAHGPFETKKYLPLLTSRGCPFGCTFCVALDMNKHAWRFCSAKNVVDQIEFYCRQFGVEEFHWEDLNPTVEEGRIREICDEIIRRGLRIIWKISSGTKIETIRDSSTIELMSKSGCRYISISPESGSARILKMMNKSFDREHAVKMIKKMGEAGIYSQACFLLGYPGENDVDREDTLRLIYNFTKAGVDEIAIFIIAPLPGSEIFNEFCGYDDFSQLTFSPSWRKDYKELNKFRLMIYRNFILWKLRFYPGKLIRQPLSFLLRRFKTKMEMAPYRALHTLIISPRRFKFKNYES